MLGHFAYLTFTLIIFLTPAGTCVFFSPFPAEPHGPSRPSSLIMPKGELLKHSRGLQVLSNPKFHRINRFKGLVCVWMFGDVITILTKTESEMRKTDWAIGWKCGCQEDLLHVGAEMQPCGEKKIQENSPEGKRQAGRCSQCRTSTNTDNRKWPIPRGHWFWRPKPSKSKEWNEWLHRREAGTPLSWSEEKRRNETEGVCLHPPPEGKPLCPVLQRGLAAGLDLAAGPGVLLPHGGVLLQSGCPASGAEEPPGGTAGAPSWAAARPSPGGSSSPQGSCAGSSSCHLGAESKFEAAELGEASAQFSPRCCLPFLRHLCHNLGVFCS